MVGRKALRLKYMKPNFIRFFTFAAIMVSWTYIPILARELGISDTNIGIIVGLYSIALFFSSYIFGWTSDRKGKKIFIVIGLLASTIAFFIQIFASDYLSLLLIRTLVGFCIGIYPSALVAYVYKTKEKMGKFASFGSLGWFVGLVLSGFVALYLSIKGVFILSSLLCLIAFLIALTLNEKKHRPLNIPFFPIKIIKKNVSVYFPFLIRHIGAHMIWTFWSLYLQDLGADLFWVAIIQSVNSIIQFLVMYTITDKIDSEIMFKAGIFLSGITFFTFTLASNHWEIIPTQVLLGISWALMYVGTLRYVTDRNVEKATVSGMLDSVLSLSSIIGPFLAAVIIPFGDYRTIMYIASALAFVSFVVFHVLKHSEKIFKSPPLRL